MKGNVTVEAALVMSFCFAVIGAVCYLGIFCYNRAVMKLTALEYIGQAAQERELSRLLEEKLEERSWAAAGLKADVQITAGSVRAEVTGMQRLIFSQPLKVSVTYKKTHPEKVIRAAFAVRGN